MWFTDFHGLSLYVLWIVLGGFLIIYRFVLPAKYAVPLFSKLLVNSQNLASLCLKYNCLVLWGMWVSFPEIWRTANGRSEFSSYQIKTVFISNNWLSKYFLLLLLVLFPYWKSEKSMDWTFNCPIMLFWILS